MQIAFWSNVSGKNGVTSNLAGVGIMSALMRKGSTLLIENHFNINNLESAFRSRRDSLFVKEEELYYYNHIGIDYLIKKVQSGHTDNSTIESSSIKFLNNKVLYIPHSPVSNKEIFEHSLNEVMESLLDTIPSHISRTFLDTSSNSLSSKTILSKVDLVVVNLSQNTQLVNQFFNEYPSILSKAVFIIGNYNKESKLNLRAMRRQYGIPKEKIAVVPYNVTYKDAISSGNIIPFLSRNFDCKKSEENYEFINELKNAVKMIERNCKNQEGSN